MVHNLTHCGPGSEFVAEARREANPAAVQMAAHSQGSKQMEVAPCSMTLGLATSAASSSTDGVRVWHG